MTKPTAQEMADARWRLGEARKQGIRAAEIGAAPQPLSDAWDRDDPLANREPGASTVTAFGQIGKSNIWIHEFDFTLATVSGQDGPFAANTIPPGMNRRLTQREADALNQKHGFAP